MPAAPSAEFVERWCARTQKSKEAAARHRAALADARSSFGFHPRLREIVYPLVYERAEGARIFDVDGNEYVDLASAFGASLFGHSAPFVTAAVRGELDRGMPLVPHSRLLGAVTDLLTELTGCERLAFATTGTEAMMAAVRLARAGTGRSRIALFESAYHGTFDAVLTGRGVPEGVTADAVVLPYGDDSALEAVEALGTELAAVLVEPVQSRRPWLVPVEFLRSLRALCDRHGIVLVFDEIVTGFRCHPGGFQARAGIRADLTAYGKLAGGGLPLGVVAGRAELLEEVDGGIWDFGPEGGAPRPVSGDYGGTFTKHPLALAAAYAVLSRLKEEGPALQERLDGRTAGLVQRLQEVAARSEVDCTVESFSSMLRFVGPGRTAMDPLFRFLMLANGVHTVVGDRGLLTLAHEDADLDRVVEAVRRSLAELAACAAAS